MPRKPGSDGSDTALFGMLRNKMSDGARSKPASRPARGATAGVKQPAPKAPAPRMARGATTPPKRAVEPPKKAPAEKQSAFDWLRNRPRTSFQGPTAFESVSEIKKPKAPAKPKSELGSGVTVASGKLADVMKPAPPKTPPAPKTPTTTSQRGATTPPKTPTTTSQRGATTPPKTPTTTSRPSTTTSSTPAKFVKTKGGDYPVYDKKSKSAESFRSAFARARNEGRETFTWVGADGKSRKYTTDVK